MNSGVEHFDSFQNELKRVEGICALAHERVNRRSTAIDKQEERIVQLENLVRGLGADRTRNNLKVWLSSMCS